MHDPPTTKATALISGEGTNLQALIDASTTTMPHLKIVRVISNRSGAHGLSRAKQASIPTTYHNFVSGKYHEKGEQDPAVIEGARERDDPNIIVCAGWMHILTPRFLNPLAAKEVPVINLHRFTWEIRARYDWYHGHFVISEIDRGEPIVIRKIRCKTPETLDELKDRISLLILSLSSPSSLPPPPSLSMPKSIQLFLRGCRWQFTGLWEKRKNKSA